MGVVLALIPAAAAWLVAVQASPRDMHGLVGLMYGLWTAIAWSVVAIALAVAIWPARPNRRRHAGARWLVAVGAVLLASAFTWNLLRLPVPDAGLHGETAAEGKDLLARTVEDLLAGRNPSAGRPTMTPCEDPLGRGYGATRVNLDDVTFGGPLLSSDDLEQLSTTLRNGGWTVTTSAQRFRDVEGIILHAENGPYVVSTSPLYPKHTDFVTEQPSVIAWSSCLRS